MQNIIKVKDLPYERYDVKNLEKAVETFESVAATAKNAQQVYDSYQLIIEEKERFETASSLCYTRYTLNTRDEFYLKEQEYYDELGPVAVNLVNRTSDVLLKSRFRDELEEMFPVTFFKNLECDTKSHSKDTVTDEQEENALVTEYSQLMSQIAVDWNGEKKPISYVRGFMENSDRNVRKSACEAIGKALEANSNQLDDIYDRLVKVRHRIAKKLGYDNFVQLGYYRMGRIDYDEEDVKRFRKNVLDDIVPVVKELKRKIAKELGIVDFKFYDDFVIDREMPKPFVRGNEILVAAQQMYHEMNKTIGAFMDRMLAAEAFDVESRDGKWGGGYATSFDTFKQPFILANFNGSSGDVDVVTHEFGHAVAFDYYLRRKDHSVSIGSSETAETHSMSMEFLCWRFMNKFFKSPDDYKYKHLADALSFIPYGVIVDEFQHIVYENPDMTPEQRNSVYLELEKRYRPYLSYEGIPYLDKGTRWQFQMHIYEMPFYYIDYCLAQVIALEFLVLSRKDYDKALSTYVEHVKRGGMYPFNTLVKMAGLNSPFGKGALREIAAESEKILTEVHK